MFFSKNLAVAGLVGAMLMAPTTATRTLAAQTSSVAVSDSTLQKRVETSIHAQPTLKNQDVDVDVNNKVATLSGKVQTATMKARAGRAAHVAGVTSVVNNITVDPKAGKDLADKTGDAAKTVAVKTGEGAKTVAVKTKDGAVATGDAITDAWINTHIHASMVDEPLLKGSDINVDVDKHMVTLKGTVASAAGKARAQEIARTTQGVKNVANNLMVGPKK